MNKRGFVILVLGILILSSIPYVSAAPLGFFDRNLNYRAEARLIDQAANSNIPGAQDAARRLESVINPLRGQRDEASIALEKARLNNILNGVPNPFPPRPAEIAIGEKPEIPSSVGWQKYEQHPLCRTNNCRCSGNSCLIQGGREGESLGYFPGSLSISDYPANTIESLNVIGIDAFALSGFLGPKMKDRAREELLKAIGNGEGKVTGEVQSLLDEGKYDQAEKLLKRTEEYAEAKRQKADQTASLDRISGEGGQAIDGGGLSEEEIREAQKRVEAALRSAEETAKNTNLDLMRNKIDSWVAQSQRGGLGCMFDPKCDAGMGDLTDSGYAKMSRAKDDGFEILPGLKLYWPRGSIKLECADFVGGCLETCIGAEARRAWDTAENCEAARKIQEAREQKEEREDVSLGKDTNFVVQGTCKRPTTTSSNDQWWIYCTDTRDVSQTQGGSAKTAGIAYCKFGGEGSGRGGSWAVISGYIQSCNDLFQCGYDIRNPCP